MYLTDLTLALPSRANPYDLHRRLWQLFDLPAGSPRPFQFRVEQVRGGTARVLMQSEIQPQIDVDGIKILRSKPFSLHFRSGQLLRFRLKANPVKTVKDEKGRKNSKDEIKSCRVPLIDEAQQIEWLARKLGDVASLGEVVIRNRDYIYFQKRGQAGKVVAVTFEGELLVNDYEAFTEIVTSGIGPAKGFGCGMMSLAPA